MFDKLARPLLSRTVLPVPTATTKGVLVAPTVFGNVMLGPTADDIEDKRATGSTRDGIARLLAQGRRIMPQLLDEEVTAVYAGLRAATEHGDYVIEPHPEQRYVCLGGIRSTGLTASMAIAEEALRLLAAAGLECEAKDADELVAVTMPNLGEAFPRPYQAGGPIVCHCERVTADEVRSACAGLVPALDLDGIRRRTRALDRPLPGLRLLGGRARPGLGRHWPLARAARRAGTVIDVLVVGGGPAGLSAAIALRRLGAGRVVVVEREQELGGIPRHTRHTGFGLRDLHRVLDGPAYARRLIDEADRAGVELRPGTSAVGWSGGQTVDLVGPATPLAPEPARAVVLATGTRERPRSARLVPGDRPAGVLTTGALAAAGRGRAHRHRAARRHRRRRARELLGRAHARPRRRPHGRHGHRPPSPPDVPAAAGRHRRPPPRARADRVSRSVASPAVAGSRRSS